MSHKRGHGVNRLRRFIFGQQFLVLELYDELGIRLQDSRDAKPTIRPAFRKPVVSEDGIIAPPAMTGAAEDFGIVVIPSQTVMPSGVNVRPLQHIHSSAPLADYIALKDSETAGGIQGGDHSSIAGGFLASLNHRFTL
jgi:hypothetical protein